jgi:hypothetical protein
MPFRGTVLNKFPGFASRWIAVILAHAFFLAGCLNLPPVPPTETQSPDRTLTFPQLTDTAIPATPSLDATPVQPSETQTPGGETTSTPSAETPTPSLEPTSTQSAATQTAEMTPTVEPATMPQIGESTIRIPAQFEWVDYGTILRAGVQGEWDLYLWGGFAFSVLKRDGIYYLYYQGSSDYRTDFDETVLWRAIGVATSPDGIHFTKYEHSPVLTWFPNQNGEEGAVSSGVTLGEQGETILFYGANTQESRTTVNADIRAAASLDGLSFTDLGVVLNRTDQSVWGSGDELFSVDAIYDSGQWIVYYIPNGRSESGQLGVAFGNQYNALNQSSAVTSDGNPISVWGTAGHVKLDQDTYALVLNNVRERRIEVRLVSVQTPYRVSEPVAAYQFDEVQQATLLLDAENEIWFMYYRSSGNGYGVKLAPAGDKPLPAPSTP